MPDDNDNNNNYEHEAVLVHSVCGFRRFVLFFHFLLLLFILLRRSEPHSEILREMTYNIAELMAEIIKLQESTREVCRQLKWPQSSTSSLAWRPQRCAPPPSVSAPRHSPPTALLPWNLVLSISSNNILKAQAQAWVHQAQRTASTRTGTFNKAYNQQRERKRRIDWKKVKKRCIPSSDTPSASECG